MQRNRDGQRQGKNAKDAKVYAKDAARQRQRKAWQEVRRRQPTGRPDVISWYKDRWDEEMAELLNELN
jgi:hypothetical protein